MSAEDAILGELTCVQYFYCKLFLMELGFDMEEHIVDKTPSKILYRTYQVQIVPFVKGNTFCVFVLFILEII